ncbi:MAG: hypothetical protein ACTSWD_04755 [Candidatus Heimdallarchaeota archaeon]
MSKTKWGAALVGIAAVIGTVGSMLEGSIDLVAGITALVTEVGVVITVCGIRDWPIFN